MDIGTDTDLRAEVERLTKLNAILMGDDENLPRYTTKRLRAEIARANEANIRARREAVALLVQAQIGSCRCLTKSSDPVHHDPDCTYRLLATCQAILEGSGMPTVAEEAVGAERERCAVLAERYALQAATGDVQAACQNLAAAIRLGPPNLGAS